LLQVTFSQLELWLSLFLWPFVRISGLLASAPLFSHSSLPMPVKIGFGVLLTIIIGPSLPPLPDIPILSWGSVAIIAEQLLIGFSIGLVMQIVFSIAQAAGDFIGLQMGLAFASFFSADTGANTMILARILYIVSLLLFLAVDGHLALISILAKSFQIIPIAAFSLNANGFLTLVLFAATIFQLGFLLAMPVIGVLLVINISMGILNRSAPQFTVFSVGFPISLTVGLLLFAVLMTDLQGFITNLFNAGFEFVQVMLEQGLAP
jgi:flagellar biosynthetic protein FliR